MSGDRLAAARAQRQQNPPVAPAALEMTPLANGSTNLQSMQVFYAEIASIQDGIDQFNDNITKISELHSRSLSAVDGSPQQINSQIEALTTETRALRTSLKERISALSSPAANEREAQTRGDQARRVGSKFMEAIQNYQKSEQQNRVKSRQHVERQFKIVKPNATEEEVAAVLDEQGAENQIFAEALSSTDRYGESRAAYRDVQERHQDIRKMTQTLEELVQLYAEMGEIIERQQFPIDNIMSGAADVARDTEKGQIAIIKATESARRARKMRWICFIICVVVLAAIGLALGIHFGIPPPSHR